MSADKKNEQRKQAVVRVCKCVRERRRETKGVCKMVYKATQDDDDDEEKQEEQQEEDDDDGDSEEKEEEQEEK